MEKAPSIKPVQERVSNPGRQMRWPKMEKVARRWTKPTMDLHIATSRKIWSDLRQAGVPLVAWETVHRSEGGKEIKSVGNPLELFSTSVRKRAYSEIYGDHDHCCNNSKSPNTAKRYFTEAEAQALIAQIQELFGSEINMIIDRQLAQMSSELMIAPGADIVIGEVGIFNRGYMETVLEAYREGSGRAKRRAKLELEAAKRSGNKRRIATAESALAIAEGNAAFRFNPSAEWLVDIERNGFGLIKKREFLDLAPTLKKGLVDGIKSGRPWNQISRDLYRQNSVGKLFEYDRLVRTEMANVIPGAQTERYKEMGAKWEQWSAAAGHCPICAEFQGVIYKIGAAPLITGDTHPNCRCRRLPIFNK